ncbi:MAG: DegT/DnrJ/EryC1/StrS family aminotransferase [Desulfotomaculaceae bacterium]|nr:DegT/DnrJ/EryC1/StrS family aminotransferase [Desulfotomaculaceae bacterium]
MNVHLSSPDITSKEIDMVTSVISGRTLSMGPMVEKFESLVADYLGVKNAVAVNSGTSGLHLCVRALGIGKGDEVITTPFSFVASSNCLLYEQAIPVFVDIDPLTLNLDVNLIEEKITKRTKAILPVHVFGHPVEMDKILKMAGKYGLAVIEDACEALGARYQDRLAGSEGDVSVFAFYPNKQITTGEGGVIATGDERIASLCRSMRNQGRGSSGAWLEHQILGYNYRMSELNAALGVAQMERLDEILEKRRRVASAYDARLSPVDGVILPYVAPGVQMSWFVYVVRFSEGIDRNRIMHFMQERGVDCRPYFQPLHLQPLYRDLFDYREGDFPICEHEANHTLALPFFNNLSIDKIDYVVETLEQAIKSI